MTRLRQLFAGQLPQLVMFDLDGTLIDSVPDLAAAVDTMLMQLGRPVVGEAQVRDWVGNGAAMLVRRALSGRMDGAGIAPAELEQAVALFMAAYGQSHVLTRVYPGVVEVLGALRLKGIPLAIVTNKPERFVPPLLSTLGLADFFRWIVGGDTLAHGKPAPDGLLHVLDQAGVAADAALFVGDSCNDIRAARAAGVPCIGLTYGYNHGRPIAEEAPDLVLDALDQLLQTDSHG